MTDFLISQPSTSKPQIKTKQKKKTQKISPFWAKATIPLTPHQFPILQPKKSKL